ncbi:sensor histidine kinase [Clostridium hydrogenum]|uniref:sensor histidine kinase n=1 Tax=Clostridium hydrogenum TaxID=2855764 RepID=UPI001F21354C|nr:sensor histidine kinase [Clostridium hydrogenum]
MDSRKTFIIMRYVIILFMIIGIAINNKSFNSLILIFILILIINNQLRFFSLDKSWQRKLSLAVEIALTIFANMYIGGYLFTYLILLAIDSNILFKKFDAAIFDVLIIIEGIYFSMNYSLNMKFTNLGVSILIIAILYFTRDENDKKLKAQNLYDRLRISEEKLKIANKELEMYVSSIEEVTLLRERNRISREIHDSVGHALSTMVIQLGAVEKMIKKDPATAEQLTKNLRKFTQTSLDEVRMAVREIKPKEFEEYEGILNIEELIKNFKKMTGVEVRLSFTKEKWPLNSDQSLVIYRIVQEFLSNSVRHGKATIVHIIMAFTGENLVITLKDNGQGCDKLVEGVGIKSIRERAKELGGYFEYNSKRNEGFLVKIQIQRQEKLKAYSGGSSNEQD